MNLLHQSAEKPLFADLLWSKPENKHQAGKLLIIGGNSFGFISVAEAYSVALEAGVGEVRVLLPNIIQKIAGGVFEHAIFAPTNKSGSFAKEALDTCLDAANWADAVLVVGDVSRNSETAAMLELFCQSYKGIVTITKDALELMLKQNSTILHRSHTNLIMTMADLQLAAKTAQFSEPFTFESSKSLFAERLQRFSENMKASMIIKRENHVYVVASGHISDTATGKDSDQWRVKNATKATIWNLQNPSKVFEAVTTSLIAT